MRCKRTERGGRGGGGFGYMMVAWLVPAAAGAYDLECQPASQPASQPDSQRGGVVHGWIGVGLCCHADESVVGDPSSRFGS
jgi:hypothetical protein